MCRALLVAVLAVLAGCSADAAAVDADAPASSEQDLYEKQREFGLLHPVGTCNDVELRSDVALTDDVLWNACAAARKAYDFDAAILGVADRPALAPPFVFGIASETVTNGKDGASTLDARDILGALRFYQAPGDQNGVYMLGHELTHMTMMRLGASIPKVPVYVFEGIATSVGIWFSRGQGVPQSWAAHELAPVTRADAAEIIADWRGGGSYAGHTGLEVGHAEHVGGLFIEWLRAHVAPHTHHLFGAISVRMGGGATFEDAFAAEIGQPLPTAEQSFLDWVAATEGNATERFRGTVFAL